MALHFEGDSREFIRAFWVSDSTDEAELAQALLGVPHDHVPGVWHRLRNLIVENQISGRPAGELAGPGSGFMTIETSWGAMEIAESDRALQARTRSLGSVWSRLAAGERA